MKTHIVFAGNAVVKAAAFAATSDTCFLVAIVFVILILFVRLLVVVVVVVVVVVMVAVIRSSMILAGIYFLQLAVERLQ